MVATINTITVVPQFIDTANGIRPVLLVLGDQEDAGEIRAWFERARSAASFPLIQWTESSDGKPDLGAPEPTSWPEGTRTRVQCHNPSCNVMVSLASPGDPPFCEEHLLTGDGYDEEVR